MQDILRQAHRLLINRKLTISTAESCTGGLLSFLLTRLPGSSAFFTLGAVTYSNDAKNKILGIPNPLIRKHGAVSRNIALLMAANVRRLVKTDIGIGITGIAGPAGGTRQKPVGTVYIAVAYDGRTVCKKYLFRGNRASIRMQAARSALILLKTTA